MTVDPTLFEVKQGDLLPAISEALLDGRGQPIDLTDADSIEFHLTRSDGTVVVNADAAIVGDPLDGVVTYAWLPGDTDTPGYFTREWQVNLPDAVPITVPNDRVGYQTLIVPQGA